MEAAQLNLGFTKIVSPIDGVAGIANVHVGDLVGPQNPNPLVTVSAVDPILGQFAKVSSNTTRRNGYARRIHPGGRAGSWRR